MRTSEWVVVAYLLYLAALAMVRPLRSSTRRVLVIVIALADAALVVWLARHAGRDGQATSAARVLRDWMPAAQILIGYWLCGPFFHAPMRGVEAWLRSGDRWWFERAGLRAFVARAPRSVLEILELSYTSAYVLVPLGFAVPYVLAPAMDVDRYWTAVTVAELVCYGVLPWIQTRTPGALGDHVEIDARGVAMRRLNRAIQRGASIQVNTIPSGHAAGAVATALAAGAVMPVLLAPFLAAAMAIVLASVTGRYHYVVDGLLGVMVGVIAFGIAQAA